MHHEFITTVAYGLIGRRKMSCPPPPDQAKPLTYEDYAELVAERQVLSSKPHAQPKRPGSRQSWAAL